MRLGRFDDVARHLPLTDFRQLRSFSLLNELYLALEGRGFSEAERQIAATALVLNPADLQFQERARLLATRRSDLFQAATPQNRPRASRAMKDRLRDLMVWR